MRRPTILDRIRALDPERDHERIVFLSTCYDFPFDTTRALEFALFRTFCVPRIARLLDGTGEFRNRAQKRYDDTDIIVSELMEYGYSSERGSRALARMNAQHGRFKIANDDFRYVLSTFIYEPIRWNARFGWRKMCETERLAHFHFWRQVGERMGIKDIPADYAAFERYNIAYEQRHFRYTEASRRIGAATIELFANWFPRLLRPLVRRSMYAIMDDPVIDGLRLSETVAGDARVCDRGAASAGATAAPPARPPPSASAHRDAPPLLSRRLPHRGIGAADRGARLIAPPLISPNL